MTDNPRIGKDVIESLTLGMYEDCRFIYREYIQNSADQVDKAVAEKLINAGEDEIHITINPEERCIVIEDNATGISSDKVVPILRNIAHSTKKRGEDKGFRGIGRRRIGLLLKAYIRNDIRRRGGQINYDLGRQPLKANNQ